MTLKTRNTYTLLLFFVSLAILLANGILSIYKIRAGTFAIPHYEPQVIFLRVAASDRTFLAGFVSQFVFLFYVSAVAVYFATSFEKTQSSEIIFFSLFMIGCLCESSRALILFLNLSDAFSTVAYFCARLVTFGRMLAPLGLFATVTASGNNQRQNVERNILIIAATSLLAAMFTPIAGARVSARCLFTWGERSVFTTVCALIIAAAVVSEIIDACLTGKGKEPILGFSVLAAGYVVTSSAFSILSLAIGTVLLFGGSIVYFKSLHRQYLWQ